jgi:hypothetical protein
MLRIKHPIVFIALLFAACNSQAPQRPSQRTSRAPEPDSAALALLTLNQQLAQSADEQLLQLVQSLDEPYALYEGGVWMRIINRGDETVPAPKTGEEHIVRMRVYTLNGQLLEDSEGSYCIQKHELPPAVDMHICELHAGGKARMYAPWYSAFGLKGTDHIPPYENVIIETELR